MKTNKPAMIVVIALLALIPATGDGGKLVDTYLFKPQEIARVQKEIGITKNQRTRMMAIVDSIQGKITRLEWDLKGQEQKMENLLKAPKLDTTALFAQADTIMAIESRIKKNHLKALVQIRSLLTAKQLQYLYQVKSQTKGKKSTSIDDN